MNHSGGRAVLVTANRVRRAVADLISLVAETETRTSLVRRPPAAA